jgi:hypothetical protein
LNLLTQSANLLRILRLLPAIHAVHPLEEQVRRLCRIHGLIDMVILSSLLEDTNAVEVTLLPFLIARIVEGLWYFVVGVVANVEFDDGRGESGQARHQGGFRGFRFSW